MILTSNNLQHIILEFKNWSEPFNFFEFVLTHPKLVNADELHFRSIWEAAVNPDNWNYSDLNICCQIAQDKLTNFCALNNHAIAAIVRAASYDWR